MSRFDLTTQRDIAAYRERIFREQKARERGDSQMVAAGRPQSVPIGHNIQRVPAARLIMPCANDPEAWQTTPPRYTRTLLPPRTDVHRNALEEMNRLAWYEPGRLGWHSSSATESPGMFMKLTRASTPSVSNPAAPMLHWKMRFSDVS